MSTVKENKKISKKLSSKRDRTEGKKVAETFSCTAKKCTCKSMLVAAKCGNAVLGTIE